MGGRKPPSYQIRSTGAPLAARRILEAHDAGGGEGEIVLHARWRSPSVSTWSWLSMGSMLVGPDEVERAEDRPETVMPHVGHGAAAEIVPAAEQHVGVVGMIRALALRAQPEVPIEAFGNRRRVGGEGGILRPHRAVGPIVNLAQRADGAIADPAQHLLHGAVGVPRHEVRGDAGGARGFDHALGFHQAVGDRLVHDDVLAALHGRHGDHAVQVVRRHDLDGIQVFLFVEELAKSA